MREEIVDDIVSIIAEKKKSVSLVSRGSLKNMVETLDKDNLRRLKTEILKQCESDSYFTGDEDLESFLNDTLNISDLRNVTSPSNARKSLKDNQERAKMGKVKRKIEYMIKDLIVKEKKRASNLVNIVKEDVGSEVVEPLELDSSDGELEIK